ncbi:MAG TPA: DUF6458 family protein [Acidimicrobiales bacterium]|jgi:hypothetical protein|nr:DUF6458 family protein [Acidimicrobiales bacterium]
MGIGISVFLIAVGAILKFAVELSVSGVDIGTVGVILMIAGAIGLLWSLIVLNGGGWGRRPVVADDVVDEPVGARRRFVRRDPYVG